MIVRAGESQLEAGAALALNACCARAKQPTWVTRVALCGRLAEPSKAKTSARRRFNSLRWLNLESAPNWEFPF